MKFMLSFNIRCPVGKTKVSTLPIFKKVLEHVYMYTFWDECQKCEHNSICHKIMGLFAVCWVTSFLISLGTTISAKRQNGSSVRLFGLSGSTIYRKL
jgi:high-affinity nickel permease